MELVELQYGIDLLDTEGNAIEPGVNAAHYVSEMPFPIPCSGDIILSKGRNFKVEHITYEYKFDIQSEKLISTATITCQLVEG